MNVWYGILICGFFSCALTKSISVESDKTPFTLDEAAVDKFKQKGFNGKWISDTEFEYRDVKTGDVNVLNAETLKSTLFFPNSVLENYKAVGYNVSADRKYVLVKYNSDVHFRHSTIARYAIYSIADKVYYNISRGHVLPTAQWGPKGNSLIFNFKNNLFYMPSVTPNLTSQAITTDGISGVIFNGVTDWVYEEEVLCTQTAFYFSPKGDQLIYVKFNDTAVGKVRYDKYGTPGDYKNLYPRDFEVRFPKVGTKNPNYEVWWVNLNNVKEKRLLESYSPSRPEKEVFYGQVYANNSVAMLVFSNRVQNESRLVVYPLDRNGSHVMTKLSNSRGWANTEIPKFSENPNRLLRINPLRVGNDEYDHLWVYTEKDHWALTNGTYEVIDILDWDRERKVIYYRATETGSPSTIQVYRISEEKGSKPYCLTCRIKSPEGRGCKHATAIFSKKYSYVIIKCNGPDPRMTYLFKNENPMKDALMVLDSSAGMRAALSKKLMPEIMNLTAPLPGNFRAEVRLYLPPNMDKSGKAKYPMLLYVYGGINSKLIYDDFKIDFEMYLTTNRSVIYAVVDARNTLNKGKNMLYAGYKRIGTIEMEDQITVTKYLQKTFPFIDTTRTGIWGWSFGGYATLKIMQMDKENIFKCGVAVAPAVDWALYDTMWSERYMKSFAENKDGYLKASLFTDVKNLKGKNFYLITGNADDNVHYQQPMLLTRALELNDILFESLSYPDEAHSLLGVRPHLYHSMDRFWKKCFKPKPSI